MKEIFNKKDLQFLGKAFKNPEFAKAFIVSMMKDEDYQELKDLYTKLDKKDIEIENNLNNIILASKLEEPAVTPEERVRQNSEKLGVLFGELLGKIITGKSMGTSLKDYENRVPVLLQERAAIIDEISTLYDSYKEAYNKEINSQETRDMLLMAFGKKDGDMEGEFLEWIMRLQK
jgi:hypothetical protein|nr:MAG TPA: Spore germination GerD central core domain [Caudoviricetes sp.]